MTLIKNICQRCINKHRMDPGSEAVDVLAPWTDNDEDLWDDYGSVSCVHTPNDKFTVKTCTIKKIPERCTYKVEHIVNQQAVT